MSKFLKNIIILSSLLVAYLGLMNGFQRVYNNDPTHYRLQYQECNDGDKSYEGIIIGTSHAAHSMVPSILDSSGIGFYNFALDGSNSTYYHHWYHKVFLQNRNKTKYCIIGIDWFMFDRKKLWRIFEHDAAYFKSDLFYDMLLSREFNSQSTIVYRFPALKYRESIFKSLALQKGDTDYPANGFDRGYIPIKIPFVRDNFDVKLVSKVDTSELIHFKNLVSMLHNNGVNIIFVMTPEYGKSSVQYENLTSLDAVARIAKEQGIPFLNFNTRLRSSINDDITCFVDYGHLSEHGSRLFSKKLSVEIDSIIKVRMPRY